MRLTPASKRNLINRRYGGRMFATIFAAWSLGRQVLFRQGVKFLRMLKPGLFHILNFFRKLPREVFHFRTIIG